MAAAALAATITATASGAFASQEREAGCRLQSGATALIDQENRGKLTAQGFTDIRSIGREDGCMEAKGIDKAGKRFEVYLRPPPARSSAVSSRRSAMDTAVFAKPAATTVQVWDPLLRICHWTLAAGFAVAFIARKATWCTRPPATSSPARWRSA